MNESVAGRTKAGQFVRGHTIKSPGRPRKQNTVNQVDYLGLLRQAVTEAQHLAIISKAIEDAKNGSRHARAWLYSHLMPKFPRLSHHELSILEPQRNDGTDVATPEYMLFCECCKTEEELEIFAKLYERVEAVRSLQLIPATEMEKESAQ